LAPAAEYAPRQHRSRMVCATVIRYRVVRRAGHQGDGRPSNPPARRDFGSDLRMAERCRLKAGPSCG
jgi:hypothetical protein